MSEFMEKHATSKLIGSPPGYVGFEEGGLLTKDVRKNPNAIILFDEIEKAHEDIFNVLLQVMDYGILTDNQGRKADFRNCMIIMTSNAGAREMERAGIGFGTQDAAYDEATLFEAVNKLFPPEFRNRLNRIVMFNGMDEVMGARVVEKKLGELSLMLSRKHIELITEEKAKELLRKKGISREYGAREVERVIRNEIKPLLVDDILFGKLKNGGKIKLSADAETFTTEVYTTIRLFR